jgi:hypothetical protein
MNRIIIWLASILLSGAGSYIFKGCETKDKIKELEHNNQVLNTLLEKSLTAFNDSVNTLNHNLRLTKLDNMRLYQLDSANKFFIAGKEKVLFDMRNLYLDAGKRIDDLNYQLAACETWKQDAADGIIIQRDTVMVKKKLFGGYKIVN